MSNYETIIVLRGISSIGDAHAHGEAVGALIALGYGKLARAARDNFDALNSRLRRKRELEESAWAAALAQDPSLDVMEWIAAGGLPAAEDHWVHDAEAERRTIKAEVDAIAEGLYDVATVRDEEGAVQI